MREGCGLKNLFLKPPLKWRRVTAPVTPACRCWAVQQNARQRNCKKTAEFALCHPSEIQSLGINTATPLKKNIPLSSRPPSALWSSLSPFRSHSCTCLCAHTITTLQGKGGKDLLASSFFILVCKKPSFHRGTERDLKSRAEESRGELPCLRSPSSVSSHYYWSHWLCHSSRGREAAQRKGGGERGGGLRGSAEDHPVVELPIFRRWQILGLNKAATTAEDHGGCGLDALWLRRLSQGKRSRLLCFAFSVCFLSRDSLTGV